MKKLKGRITISRVQSSTSDDFMTVRVTDDGSSCEMIEAVLPLADFMKALTGRGDVRCDVEFNDSDVIGKRREHKRIEVPISETGWNLTTKGKRQSAIRAAVAKYETDGWRGCDRDMENMHNFVRAEKEHHVRVYTVSYERYVTITGKEETDGRRPDSPHGAAEA